MTTASWIFDFIKKRIRKFVTTNVILDEHQPKHDPITDPTVKELILESGELVSPKISKKIIEKWKQQAATNSAINLLNPLPGVSSDISVKDEDTPPPIYDGPITVLRNISYYDGSDAVPVRHQLDIYFSPIAIKQYLAAHPDSTGVPIDIHVRGGGWQRGHKSNKLMRSPNFGCTIARHGMIAVCPSYRLATSGFIETWLRSIYKALPWIVTASCFSSWVWNSFFWRWFQLTTLIALGFYSYRSYDRTKVQHPDNAIDVCRAVKWVREHLQERIPEADLDRIFLSGHSAGAHLISLISTDPSYFRMAGLEDSSFIRGVCAISGVYSLHGPVHRRPSHFKNFMFRITYGISAFGFTRRTLTAASPITHVTKSSPPFLLMSAANDMGLENDAAMFKERLEEVGVPHQHFTISHTNHGSIAVHFDKHAGRHHLMRFIERYCKSSIRSSDSSSPSSAVTGIVDADVDGFIHVPNAHRVSEVKLMGWLERMVDSVFIR